MNVTQGYVLKENHKYKKKFIKKERMGKKAPPFIDHV
jgi:hypothetical protein